jgi:Uma2 family endonuclease
MNAPWTRAAEGLPRRAFTVKEVERMVEVGLLAEDERIELIGGEIVPMSPKGNRHELVKAALLAEWLGRRPNDLRLIPETTFRLSNDTYLEPDVIAYPREVPIGNLAGHNALLAVEIADSSLGYDLGIKANIYASFGVRELWVIDAVRLVTHVHTGPGRAGYLGLSEIPPNVQLAPFFVPELAVTLADLDLGA